MASIDALAIPFALPKLPVPHKDFIRLLNEDSNVPVADVVAPYNDFEGKLREGFAQYPRHQAIQDSQINAVPIFAKHHELPHMQARRLDDALANQKYIMPLKKEDRKPTGPPAFVESMKEFQKNFNLFSESSLSDIDWSNVVAAGSSVVTSLLPVPNKFNTSKKVLREYYHQKLAPSSDVDLFILGLDEAAAIEKIKQIETSIRNALLDEVTTIRTKNAITIASHYPTRHVQIVLRLYNSVSEILTGFDVDCSCFAYDGTQVYGTPRGIAAIVTQVNTIDLTRRSPSYESRLSKYAHRGFEVYWPELDRSKIDPTIFERSFPRTMGLARLLVLERLPKPTDREDYLAQRREERGRPALNTYYRDRNRLTGNVKDQDPDDVAEWVYDDEVSNYHSFTVPYGPKFHAKKIEKILFTKDLLLNAEWNVKKDRKISLHRHPCFIGDADSVMHDCCGSCPVPKNDEEVDVAAEEGKIYVSGKLTFMKDDPGRQTIGSFNPLTSDDYTEQAYIGNTAELCLKIVDCELYFVEEWCARADSDINRRDHTGRTPLQLACQCSTPEIVACLVANGARIVARLIDGMTALHIAAARGNADMVNTLLTKSESNEQEEAEKEGKNSAAAKTQRLSNSEDDVQMTDVLATNDREDYSGESGNEDMSNAASDESDPTTEGSFVKVKGLSAPQSGFMPEDEEALGPDIYEVNVVAWDAPVSPLHLAILGAHVEVIKTLIGKFGADALLPVKLIHEYSRDPKAAIMTLVLAARLPAPDASKVSRTLLSFGASPAQGDMHGISVIHYVTAMEKVEVLKECFDANKSATEAALSNAIVENSYWHPNASTPLTTSIKIPNPILASMLLGLGVKPSIGVDEFVPAYNLATEKHGNRNFNMEVSEVFAQNVTQPIILAIHQDVPTIVQQLLDHGVDANTIDEASQRAIFNYHADGRGTITEGSLLDLVNARIDSLGLSLKSNAAVPDPIDLEDEEVYMRGTTQNSYKRWYFLKEIQGMKKITNDWRQETLKQVEQDTKRRGLKEKRNAIINLRTEFELLRERLLKQGALTLKQLYPDIPYKNAETSPHRPPNRRWRPKVDFRVHNLTETMRENYLQLFEAVWEGNISEIKEITLAPWGHDEKTPPLQIAVSDAFGFSPFVIALYRDYLDVARLIIQIAQAQHQDEDSKLPRRRYRITDDEYDDGNSDHVAVSSELIDENYTIDNIAALRQTVASKVSASQMITWNAPYWMFLDENEKAAQIEFGQQFSYPLNKLTPPMNIMHTLQQILSSNRTHSSFIRYAIVKQDMSLLRFLIQCGRETFRMEAANNEGSPAVVESVDFRYAVEKGYIQILTEFIKLAGAELPIDAFLKHSGVAVETSPKYYQGLTIGGQKMEKWAQEYSGTHNTSIDKKIPPLLQSAYQGGLLATEWFLSDTPTRLFKEFGDNNRDYPGFRILAKAQGGFDQALRAWLGRNGNLALHAAVLSRAKEQDSLKVITYLIDAIPDSLETKSKSGHTPLSLAFNQGRIDAARLLIAAGADQTVRDSLGRNIVHLALCDAGGRRQSDASRVRSLLDLVDRRLLSSMFEERSANVESRGLTPLALWLGRQQIWPYGTEDRSADIYRLVSYYGTGEDLRIMDGSGQYPLHQVIKSKFYDIAELMIQRDPSLLWKENAMGQTPLELIESLYIRHCISKNPNINPSKPREIENREPERFTEDSAAKADADPVLKTWQVCKSYAAIHSGKRKLISVSEARAVGMRLAEQQKVKSEKQRELNGEEDGTEQQEPRDEVSDWLGI